jgi:hypothetical protein
MKHGGGDLECDQPIFDLIRNLRSKKTEKLNRDNGEFHSGHCWAVLMV